MKGANKKAAIVRVIEGAVQVNAKKLVLGTAPKPSAPTVERERRQVSGPRQLAGPEEYEQVLVTLTANQQIVVGADIFEQAQIDQAAKADAFSKWIQAHQ